MAKGDGKKLFIIFGIAIFLIGLNVFFYMLWNGGFAVLHDADSNVNALVSQEPHDEVMLSAPACADGACDSSVNDLAGIRYDSIFTLSLTFIGLTLLAFFIIYNFFMKKAEVNNA